MPSKRKKGKAKGRRAVGKGHADVVANEQKQVETLDSQMQRLQIAGGKQEDNDEEALLEEAIKLAAAEEKEIEEKRKENCDHGYNPSSPSEEHFCQDFMEHFMTCFINFSEGDTISEAFHSVEAKITNSPNIECIKSCFFADGAKLILDGNYDDARLHATLAKCFIMVRGMVSSLHHSLAVDVVKMMELIDADEQTLVQFFQKQIPCSCLDEKYKEVKAITKIGICINEDCPLPDRRAIRSKMMCCTRCNIAHYCSRKCQKVNWSKHKNWCGKSDAEISERILYNNI
jgi:hypothetical protein